MHIDVAGRPWRVPYPKFGDGPGLKRVSALAERLGLDLAGFGAGAAAIVGSNGKGSTSAMTAALLRKTGHGVGLFTSPHLFDLNERFRIDDEDISDEELAHHWRRVGEAIERYQADTGERVGGFEFLFLIAADWFTARRCTHTVWEAGIGGRHDPVRLIAANHLALTSLDLEHTQLLGDTLAAIARDKLDAAPAGARVFAPETIAERELIAGHCADSRVRVEFVPPLRSAPPLAGAFQRDNAALAVALAGAMTGLDAASLEAGLAGVRWPGRLECIGEAPLVVIDVGHTPAAVRAALAGFESMRGDRPAILVCGASADKKYEEMIAVLACAFPRIICASAIHKGAAAAEIAICANHANPAAEIVTAESVADARALALAKARGEACVYVAGGLFLAAEFKAVHSGRDPASLVFF